MRPGVSHVAITEHTCAFLYFVIEKLNTIESETEIINSTHQRPTLTLNFLVFAKFSL